MLYIFLFVLLILLLHIGIAYFVANKIVNANINNELADQEKYNALDFSNFTKNDFLMYSKDNYPLQGVHFTQSNSKGLVILCHGFGVSYFTVASRGKAFLELGYDILLYNHVHFNHKNGRKCGMGGFESDDLELIVQHFKTQYSNIVAYGLSMGAATVLMHSGKYSSAGRYIAESSYLSVKAQIESRIVANFHFAMPVYPFIRLWIKFLGGYDTDTIQVGKTAANSTAPILLMHGEADDYIPYCQSKEIEKLCPMVQELHIIQGAAHVGCFEVDPIHYKHVLQQFLSTATM